MDDRVSTDVLSSYPKRLCRYLRQRFGRPSFAGLGAVCLVGLFSNAAVGLTLVSDNRPVALRLKFNCPTEIQPLAIALLRDLPSYVNRASVLTVDQPVPTSSHALFASQPDFTPLPTDSREYPNPPQANLHQIFFTLMERRYQGQQVTELQHYYWLFLARSQQEWYLAMLFSRLGSYPQKEKEIPISPIRDASQSITARAVRTWLRDCHAGAVPDL